MALTKQQLDKMVDGQIRTGDSFHEAIAFLFEAMSQVPGAADLLEEIKRDRDESMRAYNAKTSAEVVDGRPVSDSGGWYDNTKTAGPVWAQVQQRMLAGSLSDAVPAIDRESGLVVRSMANPRVWGDKARGLVVGYVQAGKTANYTAVAAKAVDEGYRMVIVLAGMHNNLRQQTQDRLDRDLFGTDAPSAHWYPLTGAKRDIGPGLEGLKVLGNADFQMTAVVKKNPSRLANLVAFMREAKKRGLLARTPVLIIDDESDQATPNTEARADRLSGINSRVRQLWELVETGSYVAYTATPFANIFMNPDDRDELYPADFVYPLDQPAGYLGAEKIFGLSWEFSEDGPDEDSGHIRTVPSEDVRRIVPDSPQAQVKSGDYYDPEMVSSLSAAVQWFVLASAVRRVRGQQGKHSSMLVHTGAWKDSHFELRDLLQEYLEELRASVAGGDDASLAALYDAEVSRVGCDGEAVPAWVDLWPLLPRVLADLEVLADNGDSDYRVSYPESRARTVIVVGGNTLARGLTLEGLVCSYFVRRASSYDTLLQMGRWFGFRPGYADLVRIWTSVELAENYAFLAGVEAELRQAIRRMAEAGSQPRDVGIAVRTHPGRLEITAQNKMVLADTVTLSLGGHRHQTTKFDEHDGAALRRNQESARALTREALAEGTGSVTDERTGSVLITGVPSPLISRFLADYAVSPEHVSLQPDKTAAWVEKHADRNWNVVLRAAGTPEGRTGDVFKFAPGLDIPLTRRAPLRESSGQASADLRVLMAGNDVLIDLQIVDRAHGQDGLAASRSTLEDQLQLRQESGDIPLLVLYAIDKDSPADRYGRASGNRRDMNAEAHIIGMGLVLPDVGKSDVEYVAVTPTLSAGDIDDAPEVDTEADFVPSDPQHPGECR